ncbi:hypothetical protein IJ425_07845 [bacterium]|nr:hypothetical protein [bacterium]
MSKFADYKEFKKHQPFYKEWKNERDKDNAKKTAYIKSNPIPNDEFKKDIERAKIVLNAVNTMDEYSQTKAEEMENLTTALAEPALSLSTYAGFGLAGGYIMLSKSAKNALTEVANKNYKNILKLVPAAVLVVIPALAATTLFSFWSAKKQVEASRLGRTEAIVNDLSSTGQFALLTDEQKQQVEKIADGIQVDKKEAKKTFDVSRGSGIISSIKSMFAPDKELINKQHELNEKFNSEIKNASSLQLTAQEELEAKKDKELIQTIVEKVDIASQDYAENAELTTSTLQTVGLGLCGGGSVLINKIVSKIKPLAKDSKLVSAVLGFAGFIAISTAAVKIQTQASRVGRFKAKQDLLNNPEQLLYVDKEKYAQTSDVEVKKDKKGFFTTLVKLFKDNKEYNDYIKNNSVRETQLRKAKAQIELTPEQEVRAKQLQNNTFKMFNKLDEKSQKFSESTEALGDVAQQTISLLSMIPTAIIGAKGFGGSATTKKGKILASVGMVLSLVPSVLLNIFITKEQRNASRVANMQAIKELDDYKHFAQKNEGNAQENTSKTPVYFGLSEANKNLLQKLQAKSST